MYLPARIQVGAYLPGVSGNIISRQAQPGERCLHGQRAVLAQSQRTVEPDDAAVARRGIGVVRKVLKSNDGVERHGELDEDSIRERSRGINEILVWTKLAPRDEHDKRLGEVDRRVRGIELRRAQSVLLFGLGLKFFLVIEPGWMFTSNGVTPLEGKQVTVLATKFGGKERNATVLRNVLMWGMLLANREDRIHIGLGGTDLSIDPVPALSSAPAGIDGDTMNLDRIFSGSAGGEVVEIDGQAEDELDEVLTMAVMGALGDDDGEIDLGDAEGA